MAKRKINSKSRNIVDEIYFSFDNGYNYGLDLGCDGKEIDYTATSGNLDFILETQQTHFENVYFNAYIYDYNTKNKIYVGFFYFKDNHGVMTKNMMLYAYDIIEAGNKITKQLFDELG